MQLLLKQIGKDFDCEIYGNKNLYIEKFSSIKYQGRNVLTWAQNLSILSMIHVGAVVTYEEYVNELNPGVSAILCKSNLRLLVARIIKKYFEIKRKLLIRNSLYDTDYERFNGIFVDMDAKLGEDCIIDANVSIHDNVTIGDKCIIQSGVSIGTKGMGFVNDDHGDWYSFPQIGGVIIDNDVIIGANSTIRRATLGYTTIGKGTKLGSLCNVGHNCEIGENCLLITGSILGGSVTIGANAYIGMNACIKNKIKIGEAAVIGMGSVVIKNVLPGTTVVGNPAKVI